MREDRKCVTEAFVVSASPSYRCMLSDHLATCRIAAPLLVLLVANALAITNGTFDGNKHPAVGALVDYDSRGTSYAFCTGTLIDSGGPNFIGSGSGETKVLAGTTITGDAQCVQSNVVYRLDTRSARAFLKDFVTLP